MLDQATEVLSVPVIHEERPLGLRLAADPVAEDARVDHVDIAPQEILELTPERKLILESPTDAMSSSDHHVDVRVRPEVGILYGRRWRFR